MIIFKGHFFKMSGYKFLLTILFNNPSKNNNIIKCKIKKK